MKVLFLFAFLSISTFAFAQVDSLLTKSSGIELLEEPTYSITITVTHIRNRNGVIRFKFYDDTTPFPDKMGFLKVVVPKSEMSGDSLRVTCHGFKSQNMAIALLDDEDGDNKLEFGWFFPKEGHAFSDYYHASLRRPVYKDFNFVLTGDRKVVMKMKYY